MFPFCGFSIIQVDLIGCDDYDSICIIQSFIENGIKAQEQGEVKNKGTDNEIQSVRGSYSYTGPDGVLYEVTYIADENGFQPQVSQYAIAQHMRLQ